MKALPKRKSQKPVYTYIDEFTEYASEEQVIKRIFRQARKYELGLIVATQDTADLSPTLRKVIFTNTAIRFIGQCESEDRNYFSKSLDVSVDYLRQAHRGLFVAYIEDYGTMIFPTEPHRLDQLRELNKTSHIRKVMRERYSPPAEVIELAKVAEEPAEYNVEKNDDEWE